MAQYAFALEQFEGYSHSGSVTSAAKGTVELSEEDVATLVKTMREKGTSNIVELGLEDTAPTIYDTLYDACRDACFEMAQIDGLFYEYYEGMYIYDENELIEYCIAQGFSLEKDIKEYLDEDGCFDSSLMSRDEEWSFRTWLKNYIKNKPYLEAVEFFRDHMNGELEDPVTDYDVIVVIPQAIIDMAFPPKEE